MKRFVSGLLSVMLFISTPFSAFALENDAYILTDQIRSIYSGRLEADMIIENLNFEDLPQTHWAKEAVIRSGALNLIKGYAYEFKPDEAVTNREAIELIVRAIGLENEAIMLGTEMTEQLPDDAPLSFVWAVGYFNIAMMLNIITPEQFSDIMVLDQTTLDIETAFLRDAPVSREQMAQWLYYALSGLQGAPFEVPSSVQAILTYNDWESISADKAMGVDAVTLNSIMGSDQFGMFNPQKPVTRAEMAQILRNMEKVYLPIFGLTRKNGTIGAINDDQHITNGEANIRRNIFIRTSLGEVEVLQYDLEVDSTGYITNRNTVVLKNGNVGGFALLSEGDTVEYIVDPITNTILYVYVSKSVTASEIEGLLLQVDPISRTIILTDISGKRFSYQVSEQLLAPTDGVNTLLMDGKRQAVETLPYGSAVRLKMLDEIVVEVEYIGEEVVVNEVQAVVIENDPSFGTMTLLDSNGDITVKRYYEDEMRVTKEQYYDLGDDLGYITEVFPHFQYNKRETSIWEVEAGDIVFVRFDIDDPEVITSISAATNYTMRYGKIRQLTDNGDYSSMLVEYENKQTAWFDFSNNIFVTKSGRPSEVSSVIVGDWVKILVNEAIISAGYVMETVKELTVEGEGRHISTIIKGKLSGLDSIQNHITIQDSQQLTQNGWVNYQNLSKYSIAGRDIEYYDGDKRISLDYAVKNFKRSDATVYIALENNYAGEKIRKVTFRNERDDLLSPDTVTNADGNGSFAILSLAGDVLTDSGTIVRRYGRLVNGSDIMPSDYVNISLNGQNKAAIVDITDMPSVSELQIARGRILSVDENRSFKVQSMSILSGMNWVYTPVQREFAIDHDTRFITEEGVGDIEAFIGYTPDSVINRVYNIVIDGGRASYVIDSPYSTKAVRGTIYEVNEGQVLIKDAYYYENETGKWLRVSDTDSTVALTVYENTVYGKNDEIVSLSSLAVGDSITSYTDVLPDRVISGETVDSYIILVQN